MRQTTLIILIVVFSEVSSDTHDLRYLHTAVTSEDHTTRLSAVGRVDGEEFVRYNSTSMTMVPKTEWTKKIKTDEAEYWNKETERVQDQQDRLQNMLSLSQGVHVLKWIYGCQLDDNVATSHMHYSYGRVDFFHLDPKTGTWTADTPQAKTFIKNWDPEGDKAKLFKDYLETECIVWLKKVVSYRRDAPKEKGGRPDGELDEEPDGGPDGESDGEPDKHGAQISIAGVVLVLLVLVIAGIVIWKKCSFRKVKFWVLFAILFAIKCLPPIHQE